MFALRNIDDSVKVNRNNRLHPYYLVYLDNGGNVVANHTEVKRLLDLVRLSCRGQDEPIPEVCRIFNGLTHEGNDMSAYSDLLNAAIRSMVEVSEERDVDSLFSGGSTTTALTQKISGMNDFELVAFLVVQDPSAGEAP